MGKLTKLQWLDLRETDISSLPMEMEKCTNLQTLCIPSLPNPMRYRTIFGEPYLDLGRIQWKRNIIGWPATVSIQAFFMYAKDHPKFAQTVTELYLELAKIPGHFFYRFNRQYTFSPTIFDQPEIDFSIFPELKRLNISRMGCPLQVLPPSICHLQKLETIDVSFNPVLTLPAWLFDMPRLQTVHAYGLINYLGQEREVIKQAQEKGMEIYFA